MIRHISLLFILFIAAGTQAQSRLDSIMAQLLQADFLRTSEVGISIFDLTADSTLYTYQAEKRHRPASTQKLLTTITALDMLGTNYEVHTQLYHDGHIEGDTLYGNLYIMGGFDSEFGSKSMDQFVKILVDRGIRGIQGSIYGDLSMKDALPYGPGWCWDDALEDYQPVLSPLMYNKGVLTFWATPGQKGDSAIVHVSPAADSYRIENLTRTDDSSAGKFRVTRNLFSGSNLITVSGNVAAPTKGRTSLTVASPQDLFMSAFIQKLSEKNILHKGLIGYRECPQDADTLGAVTRSIKELVKRAMKVSDNLSAEALFYHLASFHKSARYASSEDGTAAVKALLAENGIHSDEYEVADGSGLSPYNYTSAHALTILLRYAARRQHLMDVLYPALPVTGTDGTLNTRMTSGPAYRNVRAKTGTLTGVSALAGYLTAANGHIIAFAILNQNMKDGKQARAFQDKICQALCE